jgi:DNA-binding transcriptional MerR regulator
MIEEIELGGIKVPLRDLETTPESIKQVLKILMEERKEIKQRIEELEEKLNKNSKNSSIPPSKNGFGVKTDKEGKAKKKPLRLTVKRAKAERKLYAVEECEEVHNAHGQSFFEISRAFCLGFPHSILSGGSTSFSNSYCSAVSYTKP